MMAWSERSRNFWLLPSLLLPHHRLLLRFLLDFYQIEARIVWRDKNQVRLLPRLTGDCRKVVIMMFREHYWKSNHVVWRAVEATMRNQEGNHLFSLIPSMGRRAGECVWVEFDLKFNTRHRTDHNFFSLSLSLLDDSCFFLPSNEILLRLSRWGEANEVKESEAWLSPAQIIYSITKMVNPKVTERQSWELSWGFCGRWLGWAEFWHSHGQERNLRWLKKYWVLRRGKLPSSDIF